jgi:hypothetical protein
MAAMEPARQNRNPTDRVTSRHAAASLATRVRRIREHPITRPLRPQDKSRSGNFSFEFLLPKSMMPGR